MAQNCTFNLKRNPFNDENIEQVPLLVCVTHSMLDLKNIQLYYLYLIKVLKYISQKPTGASHAQLTNENNKS